MQKNHVNWTKDPYWRVWNLLFGRSKLLGLFVIDTLSVFLIWLTLWATKQLAWDVFVQVGFIVGNFVLLAFFIYLLVKRWLTGFTLPTYQEFKGFFKEELVPVISYKQAFWTFPKKWQRFINAVTRLNIFGIVGITILIGSLVRFLPNLFQGTSENSIGGFCFGLLFMASLLNLLLHNIVIPIILFKYSTNSGIKMKEIYSKKTDELMKRYLSKDIPSTFGSTIYGSLLGKSPPISVKP